MTDRLKLNAARSPRKRAETAPRAGRRPSRKTSQLDRDLAELAALLTSERQNLQSPSIAADGSEPMEQPHEDAASAGRPRATLRAEAPLTARQELPRHEPPLDAPAEHEDGDREHPRRRPPLRAERAWNDNAEPRPHPRDLDEDFEHWEPEPSLAPQPAERTAPRFRRLVDEGPIGPPPPAHKRSVVTRALTVTATLMSVVALLGVSALLVLLVIGERPPANEEPAQIRAPATADRMAEPAPQAQAEEPAVITGSVGSARDESRIASEEFAIRGGGTVRAVEAGEAASQPALQAERWPGSPAPGPYHARASAPEPAAETLPPAAPAQTEVASINQRAAVPAPRPAEPAAAVRTARVNAHVNLRAKPENDAAVVTIVPEGKGVNIVACDRWCEVAYDGKQGFIHQRFLKE